MTQPSSLFGYGFIGREYVEAYPETLVVPRDEIYCDCGDADSILYMRSTVHNYHAKDGDPFIDIETNLIHFIDVLHSNMNSQRVFNLVSTWFVYDGKNIPARESDLSNQTGFYSITARAREQLLISYCETFGYKYRILRLANVVGIGDEKISEKKNALQWMIRKLAQGEDVKVYKGNPVRDYIDVRDCVRAIHLVLEKGELNQIYNISNGQGLAIRDLLQHANECAGHRGKIGEMDVPDFHRLVQTPSIYLDNSKIKKLGYVQQHDIKTSICELVNYYREQRQDTQGS